jgi:hypothetical protein
MEEGIPGIISTLIGAAIVTAVVGGMLILVIVLLMGMI